MALRRVASGSGWKASRSIPSSHLCISRDPRGGQERHGVTVNGRPWCFGRDSDPGNCPSLLAKRGSNPFDRASCGGYLERIWIVQFALAHRCSARTGRQFPFSGTSRPTTPSGSIACSPSSGPFKTRPTEATRSRRSKRSPRSEDRRAACHAQKTPRLAQCTMLSANTRMNCAPLLAAWRIARLASQTPSRGKTLETRHSMTCRSARLAAAGNRNRDGASAARICSHTSSAPSASLRSTNPDFCFAATNGGRVAMTIRLFQCPRAPKGNYVAVAKVGRKPPPILSFNSSDRGPTAKVSLQSPAGWPSLKQGRAGRAGLAASTAAGALYSPDRGRPEQTKSRSPARLPRTVRTLPWTSDRLATCPGGSKQTSATVLSGG